VIEATVQFLWRAAARALLVLFGHPSGPVDLIKEQCPALMTNFWYLDDGVVARGAEWSIIVLVVCFSFDFV